MKVIKPGETIGLLGGGQLGRMIALSGRAMGYRFATLDPSPDSPSGQVSDHQILAAYNNVEAARELADRSQVITYEFESVDAEVAEVLETNAHVPQGSRLLRITQHRIREKTAIQSLGIPVAPFCAIHSVEDVRQAVEEFGLPVVMKTATGGYDGKGQWVIRDAHQIEQAFHDLHRTGAELIVEKFIRFQLELSVIAARNQRGEVATFPVSHNIHVDNILHLSMVPAPIDCRIAAEAERIAGEIADKMEVVGLIAVEMFLTADGELYVNELAPRPHNSGHFTMDACVTSQFEQHVRAICNLSLGSTKLLSPVVMVNILGEHMEQVLDQVDKLPTTCKLHLYGKKEAQAKRKMGHINVIADSVKEALEIIEAMGIWKNAEVLK